ncbi:class I SAM-dependent methyltransferase [Halovivax gelatinilyticus]|uniref:class I SAM-dependent methyltransferase n=1 Tax=Halovivax gelatinilyticus TaxID=2961597 RepID=UPI0020CA56C6|nr:methyltransferase domain-containing protein [Halovivax gelatinilyticus]
MNDDSATRPGKVSRSDDYESSDECRPDQESDVIGTDDCADVILDSFDATGATVLSEGTDRTYTDAVDELDVDGDPDRGRGLYDWWSGKERLYDGVMGLAEPLREDTFEALSLESDEIVLDLACGPGTNFERLRDGVGPDGAVIGLDYSPGMARQAAELVDEQGWSNVTVVLGDATNTCGPDQAFDVIVTTFALHTMADANTVIENAYDALAPDGRFVVLDSRPITDGPARIVNPIYERLIAWTVNHQRGQDTRSLLEETFDSIDVVETYDAGAGYLAVATKDA